MKPARRRKARAPATNRRLYFCSSVLAAAALLAASCSAAGNRQQRTTSKASGKVALAVRVERAPRLDGTLDDPLWQQADPITDFAQREPYEGQPPTEKTEVHVLYTRNAVFFGIECFDSDPARIMATELRRDVDFYLDDHFEILIDSAHDHRNAYAFEINPLGTQRDGLITEEQSGSGRDFDPGWDGVWISNARITETGWSATIGIPFTTLNFTKSKDVV